MLTGRSAAALLAVATLTLASGCSEDGPDGSPETGPDPTATVESAPEPAALCAALPPELRAQVVGDPAPEPLPGSTPTRCHWQREGARAGLVAFVLPAEDWAAALPSTLPQLKVHRDLSPVDLRLVERLERELAQGPLTAGRACAVFGDVARLSGAEPEAGALVNFVPPGAVNPHQGVTAQRCEDGRFASLTAYAADALPDRPTARRTAIALEVLLERLG